jgi:hypothetical protein
MFGKILNTFESVRIAFRSKYNLIKNIKTPGDKNGTANTINKPNKQFMLNK